MKTTTRAAIFARKSTSQADIADTEKSVTGQLELARAFAASKGWKVTAEFSDDAVSGRLRAKLIERNKMLAAALAGEFDVLVVRDIDRLSRDDEELPGLLYGLRNANVGIWCYADGQQVDTTSALARLTVNIKAFAGTHEAEASSKRTREQKLARYSKTANVDGKVYGYRNVGDPKNRRREIEPKEAKVIVRIFELSASGLGLLKIVKELNREHVPSPTGRGWATTGVREILKRELYRGVSVYGKTRWEWGNGGKRKVAVPEREWLRVPAPELRIIPESLWKRVNDRQERTRETYPGRRTNGQLQGRREAGLLSQYLLSGFLRCGVCGGNMIVTSRSGQRGGVKKYFICTTAHHRGSQICANIKGVPYHELTYEVIETFKRTIFNPTVLAEMLSAELAARAAAPNAVKEEADGIRREVTKLEREIARALEIALAGSDEVTAVAEALRAKEREKSALQAKLEHLDGLQKVAEAFDPVAWMREMSELLSDVHAAFALVKNPLANVEPENESDRRRLADQNRRLAEANQRKTEAARRILRVCLPSPLRVSPDPAGGWIFEGEGRFTEGDVRTEVRRIQGHLGSSDRPGNPDPPKMVPPG